MNFDASVKHNRETRLGVIFRDNYGEVHSVASLLLPKCFEPHITELVAFRWATQTTIDLSIFCV